MSTTYRYTLNNFPTTWEATVDGDKATTTAFGVALEGEGGTADEALADLRKKMEDLGWFLSDDFASTTPAAAAEGEAKAEEAPAEAAS